MNVEEHPKKKIEVLGKQLAYIEMGEGDPVVFQHGNPISSYLWRNIMPYMNDLGRCIALDLIGMGGLENNVFVERVLPGSILRELSGEEMDAYRRPFAEPGEDRRPTLTWPRQIPIGSEPADVVAAVEAYAEWLSTSAVPKLFVNAEPGAILTGPQREFCRTWPNQTEVTVRGSHFIQEDSPEDIGRALP